MFMRRENSDYICIGCPMNFGLNAYPGDTPQKLRNARAAVIENGIVETDIPEEQFRLSPDGVKAVMDCVELNNDGGDCY